MRIEPRAATDDEKPANASNGLAGFPQWHGPSDGYGGEAYGGLIESLRRFLATFAEARPDEQAMAALTTDLDRWTGALESVAVDEADQVYARRADLVGRGQATWPPITFTARGASSLEGLVRFNRFFLGHNGAVHGGAVALVFDEFFGRLTHSGGRPAARTAFLKVDYRSLTPINTELRISARITREEGRKRFLSAELYDGEVLCAQGEALMLTLKKGQR